jgi:galactokinase
VSIEKVPDASELADEFAQKFAVRPRVVEAPGRVNLIGEHTDYNDGFVLPAAIQFHTSVAIAPRPDEKLVLYSENYREQIEFSLSSLPVRRQNHWSDYVIGVVRQLLSGSNQVVGANVLIVGDVPQGAGLSSSASLEVAVCKAFLEISSEVLDGTEVAKLCQRAENEFVGARCGIMDQFVSVHGKKDHALLLDCRSLEYQHQPLPDGVRLVICNTMVRHSLAGGEYNQRRKECEDGARFFAGKLAGVRALRDVSMDDFRKYERELPEAIRRRCRHVIGENARVMEAARALAQHNLERFGQLMYESHASLRDDYEVSCPELDLMVDLARGCDGVYGSRMTGGGFGGCTINLVKSEDVEVFRGKVAKKYEQASGQQPQIYVCSAADGVHRAA